MSNVHYWLLFLFTLLNTADYKQEYKEGKELKQDPAWGIHAAWSSSSA